MIRNLFVAAAVIALTVCCGGRSSDGDSGQAEPTQAGQDDLAKSYLLNVGDFPAGWAENPSDDIETPEAFEKCDDDKLGRVGFAKSGDFEMGNSGSVSHYVAVYESPEQLNAAMETIGARAQCVVKAFNNGKVDDDDVEFSDAKFAPVSFPNIGDVTQAYRVTFHFKAKKQTGFGSEGEVYLDLVYVSRGRIGFGLAGEGFSPFDSNMLADLAKKADAKIK